MVYGSLPTSTLAPSQDGAREHVVARAVLSGGGFPGHSVGRKILSGGLEARPVLSGEAEAMVLQSLSNQPHTPHQQAQEDYQAFLAKFGGGLEPPSRGGVGQLKDGPAAGSYSRESSQTTSMMVGAAHARHMHAETAPPYIDKVKLG